MSGKMHSPMMPIRIRLRHADDSFPGICRKQSRSRFLYMRANGSLIRDPIVLKRIAAIVIPPAWTAVWICPVPNGHIQATGRDARGRKQYRYHPAFRNKKDSEKYSRLSAFGLALGAIRKRLNADLASEGLSKEKVIATVVALLDQTHLRVGNDEYAKTNKSFGLSTLQNRHVSFTGATLHMRFRGKSGVWHERQINDKRLVRILRKCRDLPGQELFQYRGADGRLGRIGSTEVNDYIRQTSGGEFTAKDFRTWAGTVATFIRLAKAPHPETAAEADRVLLGVIDEVAAELGNTRAVCRSSYIHPTVVEAFVNGRLPQARSAHGLTAAENSLLRLLRTRTPSKRSGP